MPVSRRLLPALVLASGSALAQANIGTATLQQDGTLVLRLRAQGPEHGDAVLLYPPDHPERDSLIHHAGGLAPGETKPFPPLADPRPPAPR